MTRIRFESVSVDFGAGPVVSEVSFGVASGTWLAVVGPNGAGKSTLLRTLVSDVEYSGVVTIGDVTPSSLHQRERARTVAYVPQRPMYPQGMSVFDYVLLGRTPHMGALASESAQDITLVWEALVSLNLGRFADRDVATLSGGETQRLSLARVLAQHAPVLVLDEATASLDLSAQHEVLELIDALRRSHGMTIVSAIHDLTAAGQFSDRVALIVEGSLVHFGTPVEVLTQTLLQDVFESSIRVIDIDGDPVIVSLRSEENVRE
ncbi:MAG: ABC transporter ATP-binding protein [Actinomycetia bacterium]|nr:ABC transporter ATP-binding protein [Actinomycetes bacterium]